MSHRPGHDGIAEILASGQFPGVAIRTPVRSAVARDGSGKVSRVLYAGQEDTRTIDRDIVRVAEEDGLDLSKTKIDVTLEQGQGLGPQGDIPKGRLPARPKRPRGWAAPKDK